MWRLKVREYLKENPSIELLDQTEGFLRYEELI